MWYWVLIVESRKRHSNLQSLSVACFSFTETSKLEKAGFNDKKKTYRNILNPFKDGLFIGPAVGLLSSPFFLTNIFEN